MEPDRTELWSALALRLGAESLSADPNILDAQSGDWSESGKERPAFVIFPTTPAQVAAALEIVGRFGRHAVIQGGLTGLAGAATPRAGEVALSLSRLNAVEAFDPMGGTVTVQAGVTLEQVQNHIEHAGWIFPLDLGARGSCQLGGNAATNAGGNRVIRYGTMRNLVLGLEVALPNGTLMTMMNQVTKNTTGIDLKHLFIGSEGALGVITRLVLKLVPKPVTTVTALCALDSFEATATLLKEMQRHLPTLSAFELMWQDFMDKAVAITGTRQPFTKRYPVYALVELSGVSDAQERAQLESFLEPALARSLVQDVIVAQTLEHGKQLWAYRESIGEMLSRVKPHAAFDVGIPVPAMDAFVTSVRTALRDRFPRQSHLFFGHLGDGNLHVLSGPYKTSDTLHEVEDMVYAAVQTAKGAISAEHGIGTIKKEFLHLSRSEEELSLMRSLKTLLDPANVLNAGRVF
jgi:FAD/FMN-containing dehydrogenase